MPEYIDSRQSVSVKYLGNKREISISERHSAGATIMPISKEEYVLLSTGEVKQFTNHAAYLQNWMSLLKDNPNVLFQASADAAKASDFLMAQYGAYLENTKNVKQTVEPLKAQGDLTPKEEKRTPEAQKKRCFHRKKELENEQQEEMEY